MSKVNEMFDKLKTIVPEGLSKDLEDKETKVAIHLLLSNSNSFFLPSILYKFFVDKFLNIFLFR